jgi:phage recombination protein Bet
MSGGGKKQGELFMIKKTSNGTTIPIENILEILEEATQMSTSVVSYDSKLAYTMEQIELIKNTIAKGATTDELAMFTGIAQRYGLDPFLKEIWFIKRAKKTQINGKWEYKKLANGEIDYTGASTLIMTSRDGYLKIAQRDPNFVGILSFAICEGDLFEIDAENYKVTHKFGSKRGKVMGAWCKVDHKARKPVITYVPLEEYFDGKSDVWKQYTTAMIIKVAEVLALKRQFGISGLVTAEEVSNKIDETILEDIVHVTPIVTPIVTPLLPQAVATISTKEAQQFFILANSNEALVRKVLAENGYAGKSSKEVTKVDYSDICTLIIEDVAREAEAEAAIAGDQHG